MDDLQQTAEALPEVARHEIYAAVSAALTWRVIADLPYLQTPLPGWVIAVVGLPLLVLLGYLRAAAVGSLPLAILV